MFKVAGPMWAQATAGADNVFARLAKTGKKVLRRVLKQREVEPSAREIPKPTWSLRSQTVKVDESAGRLIGGLFPKQAFKTQAAELRRQAALRLIRDARKVPVFAFVGLSLGASLEQKKAHTDDVLFSGIRDLFKQHGGKESSVDFEGQHFSLQSLQLGQLIGQGCNAAVFEARTAHTLPEEGGDVEEPQESTSCAPDENNSNHLPENADSRGEPSSVENSPKDEDEEVREKSTEVSICSISSTERPPESVESQSEPSSDESSLTEGSLSSLSGFSDDEDDDISIISEDGEESGTEESLDGWVLYRLSSAPASLSSSSVGDAAEVSGDSDADSDIFVLAGDEDGLQSLPDLSWDFSWSAAAAGGGGTSLAPTEAGEGVSVASTDTGGEGSLTDTTTASGLSSLTREHADWTSITEEDPQPAPNIREGREFPLAVKMMYNYSVESKADQILSAMAKETVPALSRLSQSPDWERSNLSVTKRLPPHPNVVTMYDVFVDQTPDLPEGALWYPSALPPRLNKEGGFGRNATMFLVMKKYTMTLNEFLSAYPVDMRTRCLLFTQLLEGVVHLRRHGIAHRDLKSNNVLVDLSKGADCPSLAISDFGSCLADVHYDLQLPYLTPDTDRGGNSALMAPEIKCAVPGPHSVLDYSKADLWAAGTLAYEIFGDGNPFYNGFDSRSYCEEDLPKLLEDTPEVVVKLVEGMLKRNPSQRPSPATAATCLELFLWGPPEMCPITKQGHAKGNPFWRCKEIFHWLERLTMETVCQRVFGGKVSHLDLQMKTTFLSRISRQDVFGVVSFKG